PGNALSTLPRDVFSGLSSLTWLDLRGDALTELPDGVFSGLTILETLWLNGNSLTELTEAAFRDLSSLVDLNLGSNSLTALPQGIFDGLNALQALKLHENSLTELPGGLFLELSEPEEFIPIGDPTRAARLESIWLQGNRLTALPEDAFQGLGNLRALLLEGNSLTTLPEGVFQGLSRLELLRLGDNSIASLPEEVFRGLENLERLAMDHNRLTALPGAVFNGLSRLARLNLSLNSLASLPPEIFQGLRRLEELHLNGNRLAALPPGVLDDTLPELGIGPRNQGLHVDADLKARLGFAVAAQSAAPGTSVAVAVTLHRALPVSLRVPYSLGGTASSDDFAGLSPSPREGVVFPAGETRTEITLVLPENAGVGRNFVLTLGEASEIDLLPSDPTGPKAAFLKAETLLSGSPDPDTHTITLALSAPVTLNRSFVPVILSRAGRNDSFFTSEMTLTNRGAAEATVRYAYTAHQGGGSGSATDLVAVGRQKIVPDAIEYLRSLGLPIPAGGNPIGTLAVEYAAHSTMGVSVRTTTPVPVGRAGLAYPGVLREDGFQEPVYLAGLRQTPQDRSNLAIQHMGSPAEEPIRLRVTVYSGDAGDSGHRVLDDIVLESGGFRQFDGVLGSLSNGYVRVEKTAGVAPFYAYAVINDQANSDGSFVHPVTAASLAGTTGQTLPVILERAPFSSELAVTNFSDHPKTVSFAFVSEGVNAPDLTAEFSMPLEAGEQVITPNLVDELRGQEISGIGPAGGLAGALFAWVKGGDMSGIVIGARTVSPALVAGGQYGVFYNAAPYGSAFSRVAWVEGLQQNRESRSNLALVNTGEVDESESVFSIDIYDGDTGLLVRTLTGRTVPARGWRQIDSILGDYAEGTSQGYVRIRKISGNNPFLAYGVINDGGSPGERSGDGAFLAARE
ncbi:MAG: leucine-rich repeat domain-containing protein, partial [Acidobacteria bacterium]|nr:leucine-rich repeat domain-containing protein [Acidobacteriota bacterium]